MKPLNVLIICATVIVGLAIWKSGRSGSTVMISNASGQVQAVQVDVAAIQAVIKQDGDCSAAMTDTDNQPAPASDADFDHIAAIINSYVAQAQNIPTRNCPPDFAEAYRRHLGAWSNYAIAISGHPHIEGAGESFVKNFIRGAEFDFEGPERDQAEFKQWKDQLIQSYAAISTTWTEVNALAARYGAQ